MYEHIRFETEGAVATITLHRPEVYNAISDRMGEELVNALGAVAENPLLRVVVLSGGSGKAFCSGQDLKEGMANAGASYYQTVKRKYEPLILAMRNLPKPIIGAINGVAAGAGASLALACDYILCAEEASFAQLFINIALVPDSGSSYFLPRLVGAARAFELFTTGRKVGAAEAVALGMATEVVPGQTLQARAQALALEFAARPTGTIGMIKHLIGHSYNSTLPQMIELEALFQEVAGRQTDHQEGIRAFLEKRKPIFEGK